MCTLPTTNPPKEFMIWWFLLVFKTTRATVLLYKSLHRRSAPSFIHYWAHLASTSAYGTCPQHSICALGHKSCKRHCFTSPGDQRSHLQGQPHPAARTAFQSGNTTMVSSGEKCFPTCLDSFKGSFFFIRSLPRSASLSELPASLLWPFSLGSADTQFSDSLGFLPGCLSHFSFRSWGFSDMSFCKGD